MVSSEENFNGLNNFLQVLLITIFKFFGVSMKSKVILHIIHTFFFILFIDYFMLESNFDIFEDGFILGHPII